jgi:hypothetical protein
MEEKATMLIEVVELLGVYFYRRFVILIYMATVYLSIASCASRVVDRSAIAMFPVSWRR